jgi:hypothetical protein
MAPISFPGVSFVGNAPGKKRPGNRAGAASACRYGHLARGASAAAGVGGAGGKGRRQQRQQQRRQQAGGGGCGQEEGQEAGEAGAARSAEVTNNHKIARHQHAGENNDTRTTKQNKGSAGLVARAGSPESESLYRNSFGGGPPKSGTPRSKGTFLVKMKVSILRPAVRCSALPCALYASLARHCWPVACYRQPPRVAVLS